MVQAAEPQDASTELNPRSPQSSIAAPVVGASLGGRPTEIGDRARLLDDERCRLQAQLVEHRRQAEGGQRAIEPPVDGVDVVAEVEVRSRLDPVRSGVTP